MQFEAIMTEDTLSFELAVARSELEQSLNQVVDLEKELEQTNLLKNFISVELMNARARIVELEEEQAVLQQNLNAAHESKSILETHLAMALSEVSPSQTYSDPENNRDQESNLFCDIEQDTVERGEEVIRLPCPCVTPHHFSCIREYLLEKSECPRCRASIDSSELAAYPKWKWIEEEEPPLASSLFCSTPFSYFFGSS